MGILFTAEKGYVGCSFSLNNYMSYFNLGNLSFCFRTSGCIRMAYHRGFMSF
jgi:hypothetical protein